MVNIGTLFDLEGFICVIFEAEVQLNLRHRGIKALTSGSITCGLSALWFFEVYLISFMWH